MEKGPSSLFEAISDILYGEISFAPQIVSAAYQEICKREVYYRDVFFLLMKEKDEKENKNSKIEEEEEEEDMREKKEQRDNSRELITNLHLVLIFILLIRNTEEGNADQTFMKGIALNKKNFKEKKEKVEGFNKPLRQVLWSLLLT